MKITNWKGCDIFQTKNGWMVYKNHETVRFNSLKEAFMWLNKIIEAPKSLWDDIKEAVRIYKNKNKVYAGTYLGDDDRGIYNEANLDTHFDGIYEFLKECRSLHLIFPTYYNGKDEETA
jgi:hypothetical protein